MASIHLEITINIETNVTSVTSLREIYEYVTIASHTFLVVAQEGSQYYTVRVGKIT